MDTKFTGMLTIILLCLAVSSSIEAAQETQSTTPTGEVIDSPTKPQQQPYGIGYPIENQNQPILGQPSSSSPVNQPLTGLNQPLTGLNQQSSTGFNQPLSSSSSALNQNQPFANRLNQNSFTGNSFPFLNGKSKLEVSATTIVSISIALLLAMYETGRN